MLMILELANNHNGDISRGKKIISEFYNITSKFPQFNFMFKFQRRDLSTFIHPNFQNRLDISYIKRFKETQLSIEQLSELKVYTESLGYMTACSGFDEPSIDIIKDLSFDYLKIGSCSITDWPLLNKIAESNLPVIGSVGGASLEDIQKVVSFFDNRQIPFILMYCVGLYPTENEQLGLNKIDILRQQFPNLQIGFSTHERPDNYDAVKIAIAKGISIFEKHVDLEHKNEYSIIPSEYKLYLQSAVDAYKICSIDPTVEELEKVKLRTLQRGAYLKHDVKKGDIITRDDLYFAFPINSLLQLSAGQCSKYVSFKARYNNVKNASVDTAFVDIIDNSQKIEQIRQEIKTTLDENHIVYPSPSSMEISHHYGLEKFSTYGMCLITLVNQAYCKKLLILSPNQHNPEHYHKKKKETFFVLNGEAIITIDDTVHHLSRGNLINVLPNQKHSISTMVGTVIEELSSKHYPNDSFYTDERIGQNLNRKTTVYV